MADTTATTATTVAASLDLTFYLSAAFFIALILFVIFASFPKTTRGAMVFLILAAIIIVAAGIIMEVKKVTYTGYLFLGVGAFLLIWGLILFKALRKKPTPPPPPAPAPEAK